MSVLCLGLLGTSVFAQEEPALINVATRGAVGTGENVLIAGFIIQGTTPRRVAVRVLGPSLTQFGVNGVLANPTLELNSGNTVIGQNDDWQSDAATAQTLRNINLAPGAAAESAVLMTLNPGPYTAVVRGKNDTTGVVLLTVDDLDARDNNGLNSSRTINLSTRGRVGTGDSVMIMGFIIGGSAPRDILVTAIAGSLAEYGLNDVLTDSKIEIFSGNTKIAESDDWIDSPDFETIAKTGASPRDPLEAAVWLHLAPGNYTAVVTGANGEQGIALPEVDDVRQLKDITFAPANLIDRTGTLAISTGSTPDSLNLAFIGSGSATVNTGTAGTYTYTPTSGFLSNVSVTASGYTVTGTLQFYRDKVAVFSGSLTKPGATKQDAGGVLVLK